MQLVIVTFQFDLKHVFVKIFVLHLVAIVRHLKVFRLQPDSLENCASGNAYQWYCLCALDVLRCLIRFLSAILGHQLQSLLLQASFCLETIFKVSEFLLCHLDPAMDEVFLDSRLVAEEVALANKVVVGTRSQLERHLLLLLNSCLVAWITSLSFETRLQELDPHILAGFLGMDHMLIQ